jgi:hypothetical protein
MILFEEPNDAAPVACDSCSWTGHYRDVEYLEDGMLTPGDPVPAGRCPECAALVYLSNPKTAYAIEKPDDVP